MPDADEAPQARRRTDARPDPSGPTIRILAVDDDQAYLRYIDLLLRRAGFEVQLANSGEQALEKIRSDSFDLLLIDLRMPSMDGMELFARIQQAAPTPLPYMLLLTATNTTETKLRALEGGFDDFLAKDASDSEILAKIRSAARRLGIEKRLQLANQQWEALALTDELTGLANRRALLRAAERLFALGRPLSVVLFDLEHFKWVNDTYGHLAGDRILADIGLAFRDHTRFGDIIGRYGGDEFVVLLPDTGREEAREVARRLLAKICRLRWTIDDTVVVINAQFGLATSHGAATLPDLLRVCDSKLYGKKKRRRRAAVSAPDEQRPKG